MIGAFYDLSFFLLYKGGAVFEVIFVHFKYLTLLS